MTLIIYEPIRSGTRQEIRQSSWPKVLATSATNIWDSYNSAVMTSSLERIIGSADGDNLPQLVTCVPSLCGRGRCQPRLDVATLAKVQKVNIPSNFLPSRLEFTHHIAIMNVC